MQAPRPRRKKWSAPLIWWLLSWLFDVKAIRGRRRWWGDGVEDGPEAEAARVFDGQDAQQSQNQKQRAPEVAPGQALQQRAWTVVGQVLMKVVHGAAQV